MKIDDIQKEFKNERKVDDLLKLLKTNSTIPTHTPKKFVDCFWLYYDGATTYELYVYINNEWKKATLS
jgi:hypothetical protein